MLSQWAARPWRNDGLLLTSRDIDLSLIGMKESAIEEEERAPIKITNITRTATPTPPFRGRAKKSKLNNGRYRYLVAKGRTSANQRVNREAGTLITGAQSWLTKR